MSEGSSRPRSSDNPNEGAETGRTNSSGNGDISGSANNITLKVAMVGDSKVGKTTLMVKYVENTFDEDYIQTLSVNFMEKTIRIRNTDITFSLWDLGGQREFLSMLPLVCNDAVAMFFMFDLSRKSTLLNIKEWYRQGRGLNRTSHAFLIGTKFDVFAMLPAEEQKEIDKLSKKYAKAMSAPLIFTSASHSINVQKIFKIVLSKVFDLKCTLEEEHRVGEPLFIFQEPKEPNNSGVSSGTANTATSGATSGDAAPR